MKKIEPKLEYDAEKKISFYKEQISKEGYGFIKIRFDNVISKICDSIWRLQLCHLLSIAAHEVRRETGKVSENPFTSCGLCLAYRSKDVGEFDGCENCPVWAEKALKEEG